MKLLPLPTLALCGMLGLGVACSSADDSAAPDNNAASTAKKGMEPDPDAAKGTPDPTGETNPVVDKTAGDDNTPPTQVVGQTPTGTPTWIVYTVPG